MKYLKNSYFSQSTGKFKLRDRLLLMTILIKMATTILDVLSYYHERVLAQSPSILQKRKFTIYRIVLQVAVLLTDND